MHVPGAASVESVDVSGVNLRLEALVDRPLEEPKGADRYEGRAGNAERVAVFAGAG